jgi:hypothetical protein
MNRWRRPPDHAGRRSPSGKSRWQALAGIAALAAVCAGCGSAGSTAAPPPLGRATYGPILNMVTAVQMIDGRPRGLTQYFAVKNRRVYAVAFLGNLHGATQMTMTWSRLTGHGLQPLFSKQVPVTSYGLAYSAGQTAGTLPLGTYQVSATVAGATRSVDWTVFTPPSTTGTAFAHTASTLRPGVSGSTPQSIPKISCQQVLSTVSMPSTTNVRLVLSAYCPQDRRTGPTRGALIATMDRNAGEWLVGTLHLQHDGMLTGSYSLDVCSLPGGTNRPGTSLFYTSVVYYNGLARNFSGQYVLPPAHLAPVVIIKSSVPAGSQVHPGEKIVLHVTAAEPATFGPEVAIRSIRISGPAGAVVKFRRFDKAPPGCDVAWLRRTIRFTYTVPAGAPKTLTLSASAIGAPSRTGTGTISFPVAG